VDGANAPYSAVNVSRSGVGSTARIGDASTLTMYEPIRGDTVRDLSIKSTLWMMNRTLQTPCKNRLDTHIIGEQRHKLRMAAYPNQTLEVKK
jgi:hypothetical protein